MHLSLSSAAALVEAEVERELGRLTLDRFDQKIDRPYGTLYRSALLVKADGEPLRLLKKELTKAFRESQVEEMGTRRSVAITVTSALGLALIIFLLYSFLNASTRGYFVWQLRFLSLGALLLLYVGLMYLRGSFPS